jgi:UDP-N-acetylglucosamine--N-acetylmuramyl-(pentapeptide) pyrophosphoryl-undecaprenol N-acetylglucosamine transferase
LSSLAKILYGVSPIGLGHATRSLVIAKKLESAGNDLQMFCGGNAAEFIREEGFAVEDIVSDPAPEVVGGEMKRASLWYLRSWLALRSTTGRTRALFDSFKPDLVVCDEEFSGITVAMERGCKNAFISDELELGFARGRLSRSIERRVERWYRNLQNSVDVLIVPDFGQDSGNRRYVEPVVREVTKTRTETREEYSIPLQGSVVLLSLSGSGLGNFLVDSVLDAFRGPALHGLSLVITGNRGTRLEGDGIFDLGVARDNQNLIAAADLVISTAGKSTIDEAASSGTPIIAIPIKHHAEQERNAASLGFVAEDSTRLTELISEKIGKREAPHTYGGSDRTSRVIMSLI